MKQNEVMKLRDPSRGERFKWFAISHFSISVIGVLGMLLSTALDGAMLAALFVWEGVLLALYVLAGGWIARKRLWCRPVSLREGARAALSPTLVAWIWGGIFLVFLCVPGLMTGMGDAGDIVAMILMYSLLLLAFPSSLGFIMLTLLVGGLDANFAAEWPVFFLYLLIVGVFPPLLFVLGSTFGVRKEKKAALQEDR